MSHTTVSSLGLSGHGSSLETKQNQIQGDRGKHEAPQQLLLSWPVFFFLTGCLWPLFPEKLSNYKRMWVTVWFYIHQGFPKALLQCFEPHFLSFFVLNSRHRCAFGCIMLPNIRRSLTKIYRVLTRIKPSTLPRFLLSGLYLRFLAERFPHLSECPCPYPRLNLLLLQVCI